MTFDSSGQSQDHQYTNWSIHKIIYLLKEVSKGQALLFRLSILSPQTLGGLMI